MRHLADVERDWARRSMDGRDVPTLHTRAAHPQGDPLGDFHPPARGDARRGTGRVLAGDRRRRPGRRDVSLDDVERSDRGVHSLRWILVHLVEENARHCSHADLLREAIDSVVGD